MGLPAALHAHSKSDLNLAAHHYKRALEQKDFKPVLFQNYGALLRSVGKKDQSQKIYEQGLALYPEDRGIRLNYANLIKDESPFKTLEIYIDLLAEKILILRESIVPSDYQMILEILDELELYAWSYEITRFLLNVSEPSAVLLINLYKIASSDSHYIFDPQQIEYIISTVDSCLPRLQPLEKTEYFFAHSWLLFRKGAFREAFELLNRARDLISHESNLSESELQKAQKLNNTNSWNASCILLANQELSVGWELFDFGLRAAAQHAQKWQRALPKLFTYDELQVWRGENLKNKRLFLMEEQAVGDVMQFLTLIPSLLDEAQSIGILISDRLFSIYERSFSHLITSKKVKLWSIKQVAEHSLIPANYDYQSPIGSICRYRFKKVVDFGLNLPNVVPPKALSASLSSELRKNNPKKVIGLSWRGGGTPDRINDKSIKPNEFSSIFKDMSDCVFVNLQYGDSTETISEWEKSGFTVYNNEEINPLKDMDSWLALVSACDAVVSVANTTIHGSGGLNIPTMCLLSLKSDWRWFKDPDVTLSYWYPSVGIARQSPDGSWDSAFQTVRNWLDSGADFPTGVRSTITNQL